MARCVWFLLRRHLPGPKLLLLMTMQLMMPILQAQDTELKTASQCLRQEGMSFLSLYCGFRRQIQIDAAFHGAHPTPQKDCLPLEGDCREDRQDAYNWGKCEGRHNCVMMLGPTATPSCGHEENLGYIQVDYTCIPVPETTTEAPTTPTIATTTVKLASTTTMAGAVTNGTREQERMNICENATSRSPVMDIVSPGYPGKLHGNLNCRCDVIGQAGHHMTLTIQTVSLGMHKGLCHDWLKLDFPGYPGNKLVSCGNQHHSGKKLQLMKHQLGLHFHTARGTHPDSLKGFHIKLKVGRHPTISCYQLLNQPGQKMPALLPPTDLSSLPRDRPNTANQQSASSAASSSPSPWKTRALTLLLLAAGLKAGSLNPSRPGDAI